MSVAAPVRRHPAVVAAMLVCAASMLGLGLWAFLDISHAIDRHLGGHASSSPTATRSSA